MIEPEGTMHDVRDLGISAQFLVVDSEDIIQRQHVAGKFYERRELQLLERHLQGPRPYVLDIGANVGNHSVFFASRGCQVTAFEADPYTFSILRRNLEANGLTRQVRALNVGVSNRRETLAIHRRTGNLGATKLALGKQARFTMEQEMPAKCEPLDDYLFDSITLMKIDVEGMELKVLEGASRTLELHRPLIFMEVFDRQLSEVELWARNNVYSMQATGTHPGAAYRNWMLFPGGDR